jgi:hypothetical protein
MNTTIQSSNSPRGREVFGFSRVNVVSVCVLVILILGKGAQLQASEPFQGDTIVCLAGIVNSIGIGFSLDGFDKMVYASGTGEGTWLIVLCGIGFLVCSGKKNHPDRMQ